MTKRAQSWSDISWRFTVCNPLTMMRRPSSSNPKASQLPKRTSLSRTEKIKAGSAIERDLKRKNDNGTVKLETERNNRRIGAVTPSHKDGRNRQIQCRFSSNRQFFYFMYWCISRCAAWTREFCMGHSWRALLFVPRRMGDVLICPTTTR
jgi:hypothetical protein